MSGNRWESGESSARLLSRRELLFRAGGGLAGIALATLLKDDGLLSAAPAAGATDTLAPRAPHFAPKARSVIFLAAQGGPSQLDLFDPKPALEKYVGKQLPAAIAQRVPSAPLDTMPALFKFSRHGEAGHPLSEMLPHLARVADELTFVRSMVASRTDHDMAQHLLNTGRAFGEFPSLGAWVCYGLGSENRNLPAYIALPDPVSLPLNEQQNWTAGFLPPIFQGTQFNPEGTPIFDLTAPASLPAGQQRRSLELIQALNRKHLQSHGGQPELEARIANYELAARMQLTALRQVDISDETQATRQLYGLDQAKTRGYGLQLLLARRLVESGVRFVHVFNQRQEWDHHAKIKEGLIDICAKTDLPIAGLLADLKQRGLLETTLVVFAGEFGRLPIAQKGTGRDHNIWGFTLWLAGGGIKRGFTYGATDELGYAAVENPVSIHDLHATLLHLLGLDYQRLTYPHEGRDETLIGVEKARVVKEVLV